MAAAPPPLVSVVVAQSDTTKFYPEHNRDEQSAESLEDRLTSITKRLDDLTLSQKNLAQGIGQRKIARGKVPVVKEEALKLQPELDDLERLVHDTELDIPAVTQSQKDQIPNLMERLLPQMVRLDTLREQTDKLLFLVRSEDFQDAYDLYRDVAENCNKCVDPKVAEKELHAFVSNLDKALRVQTDQVRSLSEKQRHIIRCLHQESVQLVRQLLTELKAKSFSTGPLQEIVNGWSDILARELQGACNALEQEAKDEKIREYSAAINGRELFAFNPQEYISRTWLSRQNGKYTEEIEYARNALNTLFTALGALESKIEARIMSLAKVEVQAPPLKNGMKHKQKALTLLEECNEYKTLLLTVQKRLFDCLMIPGAKDSLYARHYTPFSSALLEHTAHLLDVVERLNHVLSTLQAFSRPEYAEVAEAKQLFARHLDAREGTFEEQHSLFVAMQHVEAVRQRRPSTKLLQSALGMLYNALAEKAPAVCQLQPTELAVFDHILAKKAISSLDEGLPLHVLLFLAKSISALLFLPGVKTCNMRLELVLHMLKTHGDYRARFAKSYEDPGFRQILDVYEQAVAKLRLSIDQLNQACSVFDVIYQMLAASQEDLLATSKAWQACMELGSMKDDDGAHKEPLRELKAVALATLGPKFEGFQFPEEGREISLQFILSQPNFLDSHLYNKTDILRQALAAAIFASKDKDRFDGLKVVQAFLVWPGFKEWLGQQKEKFRPLIRYMTVKTALDGNRGRTIEAEYRLLLEDLMQLKD